MLFALLLSSSLVVAQDRAPTGPPKPLPPVAIVNGEPITFAEWQAALSRLPPAPPGFTQQQMNTIQTELLTMLVDDKLLRQHLVKTVPAPTLEQVNAKVAEVEKSLAARKATLNDYLRDTRQTLEQFRAGVTAELQWQSLVNQRIANVDLKAYYEQNKEMFDGVVIRVSHLVYAVPANADPKQVADATARLRNVRQEIVKGLDFAEAAKKYSDDKGSAKGGGDLGYFPPRRSDGDPFIRTASAMKPGEVSDVVRTDFGVHLIKVTERKNGQPSQFEAMKETVRAIWADELKIAVIMEQRKTAKIEVSPRE